MQGIPSGLDGTWVANQGAGFTSSCLREDSAIYNKNVYLPLYEKMNLSFDIRRSENGWCFPTFFKWVNIIFFAGIIIVASFIWKWRIDWCFTVGCGIWYFSFLGFAFTFITEKITQVFCMSLFKMASLISFKCGGSCKWTHSWHEKAIHCWSWLLKRMVFISGHKRSVGYMATYGSLPSYSLWTMAYGKFALSLGKESP